MRVENASDSLRTKNEVQGKSYLVLFITQTVPDTLHRFGDQCERPGHDFRASSLFAQVKELRIEDSRCDESEQNETGHHGVVNFVALRVLAFGRLLQLREYFRDETGTGQSRSRDGIQDRLDIVGQIELVTKKKTFTPANFKVVSKFRLD